MSAAPIGFFARLRRFLRDERGTSLLEFALFSPVLAVMGMGITDLSMGYSAKLSLEQAANRTLEKVIVGTVQSDYSYLRTEAATAAGVPESQVTVDYWLECDTVRQPDPTVPCGGGQMTSRYVTININSTYTPRFAVGPLGRNAVPINANASLRVQ